ncbi:alpha/beta fold hydrolase [Rhodobacter capsulatus]|uniref:alpha/beta fold hydrolase n=1 Tax=Rhodobacter capsulatus TaxID=1061 RepID=UPI0003D3B0BA|nr:alpha/beta hydrolase [Rhodobacter capsulatus]ETD83393.1 hydrolase signal peptide protein [Rhodobacter capsulatus B6]
MKHLLAALLVSLPLATPTLALAEPAVAVIGDYTFPQPIEGMPRKLSDFDGLEINSFTTNDGVRLGYWEAGTGDPIVFVPAWGASGAEMINQLWLLSRTHHVYVLDPRNQGTSERTEKGQRIARQSMDLSEFLDHIGTRKTVLVGWSMGVSVIWGYVDLFGTERISKAVFVDEPVSIYTHADWSEEDRRNAGGMTTSVERMIAAFAGAPTNQQVVDMKVVQRARMLDTPYAQNAMGLAGQIKPDPAHAMLVLFDHAANDWSDVIRTKLDIPVAVFSGEESNNLPSQDWIARTVPDGQLFSYSSADQGDHFLMQKNPIKFAADLRQFLAE